MARGPTTGAVPSPPTTLRSVPTTLLREVTRAALLRSAGLEADVVAGHSFGEIAALAPFGVADGLVARAAGRALVPPPGPRPAASTMRR